MDTLTPTPAVPAPLLGRHPAAVSQADFDARVEAACAQAGQPLTLRRHGGYDHGYYFIQSFIDDHLRHHAEQLSTP